jgi:hypothetical protein
MGKCCDLLSLLFNIVMIYFSYTWIIAIIVRYEGSTLLTVIITWLANFLMPFAFGIFVQLKFDMKEILQIINIVGNIIFHVLPVVFLLATLFSVLIFILPHYYDKILISGIKIYLGLIALTCEALCVKKMFEEVFCDHVDTHLLNDYSREDTPKRDSEDSVDRTKNKGVNANADDANADVNAKV